MMWEKVLKELGSRGKPLLSGHDSLLLVGLLWAGAYLNKEGLASWIVVPL